MKNKQQIIITMIITLILIVLLSSILFNKKNTFNNFINDTTKKIINKLEYKNISGNLDATINLKGLNSKNKIITDMKYKNTYQINLEKGIINLDGRINYKEEQYDNNVYIENNKINILIEDIYDKYITIDNEYLNPLNNIKEYKNIIKILTKEITSIVKNKNLTSKIEKIDKKKVKKITLNFSSKENKELKKKLINNLLKNEEFIKSISKYKNLTKKEAINYIKEINLDSFKISIYNTKYTNNFVKLELKIEEVDIKIEKGKNKYNFEYYLNTGLMYSGYIELNKNELSKINIENILDSWSLDINIDSIKTEYNKNIEELNLNLNNNISYNEFKELEIIENKTITDIKENYDKRYEDIDEYIPPEEDIDLYSEDQGQYDY